MLSSPVRLLITHVAYTIVEQHRQGGETVMQVLHLHADVVKLMQLAADLCLIWAQNF